VRFAASGKHRGGFVAERAQVDVAEIMEHIRGLIRRRSGQGPESEQEIEARATARLQAYADEGEIDSELMARLLAGGQGWNVSADYRIETHRRGLSARLVVLTKSLIRPLVRLYTDFVIARQAQINVYVVRLCEGLSREVVRLEARNAALLKRCEVAEHRLDALEGARAEGVRRDVADPKGEPTPPR